MEKTIFHKIVSKEIDADIVYEDDSVIAFLDIAPINKGHTLVVPKTFSRNVSVMLDEDLCKCINVAKRIGNVLMDVMKADGYNIGTNIEQASGQAVFYTHFHIIPRFSEDGLKHWPSKSYETGEKETVASKIRERFN